MIFLTIFIGSVAAFSIDSDKPAHTNYSLVGLVAICFFSAVLLKVFA